MPAFGHELRSAFALGKGVMQLNHGSYGGTPRAVLRTRRELENTLEADPIAFMNQVPDRLRAILGVLGPRLGARPQDLVFVENATAGVATVLNHLDLQAGDRVVVSSHVYGAVRQAVLHQARRRGVLLDEVTVPFPISSPDEVLQAITPHLADARLAIFDHISSATGAVMPIAALVRACHRHGVPVLVDGAHAPFHVPLDLNDLGADWFTGNLHKWAFCPRGTAILHVHPRQQPLWPLTPSHLMPQGFPHCFDWTGTRDPTAWLSVPAGLSFIDRLGERDIREHNHDLCRRATDALCTRWGVTPGAPPSMRAALATIPLPEAVPAEAAPALYRALARQGISAMFPPFAGHTWLRLSAQVYNAPTDYDTLAEAVETVLASDVVPRT